MVKLKKILSFIIVIAVIFAFTLNYERISDEIVEYINRKPEVIIKPGNGFKKNYEFKYIRMSNDYIPYNKQDLLEIFYAVLNNGWEEFTFYCPAEYTDCLNDLGSLSKDEILLSNLNSFVSSYNSYENLRTVFDTAGEVKVYVKYKYSKEDIARIDADINHIIENDLKDTMSDTEKIKYLHDYIVDRTKYDSEKANYDKSPYDSDRIHGVLYDGYAICSGYTDTMEVFLTKLGIPNYKIASDNHVWNAVYLNDTWYHLDVTWDDPVTNTGEDIVLYDYYLVDNNKIAQDDDPIKHEHLFDMNVFLEFGTQ